MIAIAIAIDNLPARGTVTTYDKHGRLEGGTASEETGADGEENGFDPPLLSAASAAFYGLLASVAAAAVNLSSFSRNKFKSFLLYLQQRQRKEERSAKGGVAAPCFYIPLPPFSRLLTSSGP